MPLIQSCSNIPIGQELSNSFDSPVEINLEEKSIPKDKKFLTKNRSKTEIKQMTSLPSKINEAKDKQPSFANIGVQRQIKRQKKLLSFTPQPYRITIKLSAANPSAPAETVTEALRMAGVSFEVEMIELIDDQTSTNDPRNRRLKR